MKKSKNMVTMYVKIKATFAGEERNSKSEKADGEAYGTPHCSVS